MNIWELNQTGIKCEQRKEKCRIQDHFRRSDGIGDQEKDRGGWKGEDVILVNAAYLNTCPKSFKAMRGKRKKVQLR